MILNSTTRNTHVRLIRDVSWPFPGMDSVRQIFPTFEKGQSIDESDITAHINDWSVSWNLGEPFATINLKCDSFHELQYLNLNDIIIIDLLNRKSKSLICAGLVSGNTVSTSCDKQITRGYTILAKEPGKMLQNHEIYYNPYTEGIEALNPYLALTGGQLGLFGSPKQIIEKILDLKMFGYDPAGNPTQFLGGFYMNDGRRIMDWIDLSNMLNRENPVLSDPMMSSSLQQLIRKDPCDFSYWPTNGSSIDGPLWRLMQTYSAQPMYELFTYTDYRNEKPVQLIFHRPLPFWCEYYGWELWDSLQCFEFHQGELSGNASFSWSEDEAASYYFINAQQTLCGAEVVALQSLLTNFNHYGVDVVIPIIENAFYERYGFKKLIPGINAIALDNSATKETREDQRKLSLDILHNAILRLWDYNFLNQYYLSGSISIPLPMDRPIPRIGMRAKNLTSGFEYYIVGVSISGGIGKTTVANLKLTRGMTRTMHQHLTSKSVRKNILSGGV